MALGDLFKSKQERKREATKLRRKIFRDAQKPVETLKDHIAKMKREHKQSWDQARQYLKDGQKAAAQRSLRTCRASELRISNLEMKRWVYEDRLTALELAKTDEDFKNALAAVNTITEIDPEGVASVLDEVQDKLGEQVDVDKFWQSVHDKEMEGAETTVRDEIPSLDEMAKQLEDEVAAEIGGGRPTVTEEKERQEDSSLKDRIGEAGRRLKDMLEDEK